jgi:hypothetical protein
VVSLIYKRLLQLGKVAGTITFLFGIPYGLWQYIEKTHETRIEQSLKMFDKFNTPPLSISREKISKVVAENKSAVEDAVMDPTAYRAAVIQLVVKNDIEASLWMVLDFFDGVAVCVVNRICDPTTISQLFGPRAKDFYITFYEYIKAKRRGPTSSFAVGLETIAVTQNVPESP